MSLNSTPSGERTRITFFGVRNAGKSSVVNALSNQQVAVTSDTPGTTTDLVSKTMELLPLGPVLLVDTPGIDDEGELGQLRVQRTEEALGSTDIAVLVLDSTQEATSFDHELIKAFKKRSIPFVIVLNKTDLTNASASSPSSKSDDAKSLSSSLAAEGAALIDVSATTGAGIEELKETLAALNPSTHQRKLISDLVSPGDTVVLVIPIDESAPKGRIILPQQQVMRDALEAGALPYAATPEMLPALLDSLKRPPRMVITDSQAFAEVSQMVPSSIPLTSFSILMARYKGDLPGQLAAVQAVCDLKDGDAVLISEGCTHHRQCEDIGTVKLPRWIEGISGVRLSFSFTSGNDFPADVSDYSVIVHCGGCMLNERAMQSRIARAHEQDIPITNYGMVIACATGILERAMESLERLAND